MMHDASERSALGFAAAAVLLWSTVATAFKLALFGLDPLDLLCLSVMVSWAALGAALLRRRFSARRSGALSGDPSGAGSAVHSADASEVGSDVHSADVSGACSGGGLGSFRKEVLIAGMLGILNPILYYWILFTAYDRLPAQIAQPLNYTWPLFLALLALPINGRGPTRLETAGILISLAGVVLIARPGGGVTASADLFGVLLAMGSGVIWALYWLIGNRLAMDGALRLFIGFSAAVIPAFILWAARGFILPGSLSAGLAAVWAGLFEMGLTFLFWDAALQRTARPARIGNLVYIGPFISLIWIALVLEEPIHPLTIVGLAVIVLGILAGRNALRLPRRTD